MTFYWWSHWFWITLLCNILFSITLTHTYPSHEISLEYNQNSKSIKAAVTKLYQTSTTLTWGTIAPPHTHKIVGVTRVAKTILQNVTPEMDQVAEDEEELLRVNGDDNDEDEVALDPDDSERANDDVDDDVVAEVDVEEAEEQQEDVAKGFEVKRSAENFNKTSSTDVNQQHQTFASVDKQGEGESAEEFATTGSVKLKRDEAAVEVNNYTNLSSNLSTNASNDNSINNQTVTNSTQIETGEPQKDSSIASATPSPPKIIDTSVEQSTLQWFNAITAQQAQHLQPAPASHIVAATAADSENSESVAVAHKVPFTLENVNKEDELRRAESEHRSRKSKVLSSEYKHINRYINFSTDSKNLLARSASTAPNEFEGDDGNISSEALAIQRTYFLDAGAISAICFTVFGLCCTVGTIGIVLYRRRFVNKPQALSEPDSSVYIDDSTVRASDNSDEMYSLDNDSFLNSLEAMTIQNYWTDTVKHTKL